MKDYPFEPPRTAEDLDSLDDEEIFSGSMDYRKGDPEPGANRGRAYRYGWHVAAMNRGHRLTDDAMRELVRNTTRRLPNGSLQIVTRKMRQKETA